MTRKPLLLLDRDGTLIEERNFLMDPKGVKLLAGVSAGLKKLRRAGFKMVVVTNQSGVGRGIMTLKQVRQVNRRFLQLLRAQKARVDGVYLCPHAPSKHCACRKPKLGLVKRAAKALRVSWRGCISVGDRPSDVALGQKTGGLGLLVLTGYGKEWGPKSGADVIVKNFSEAVNWIINHRPKG